MEWYLWNAPARISTMLAQSLGVFRSMLQHPPTSCSPIDCLDEDILLEIFFLYLKSSEPVTDASRPSKRMRLGHVPAWPDGQVESDPLILTQVCAYWRVLSMSTPMLWSTLHIYNPGRTRLPLLSHWLQLSGDSILDITLQQDTINQPRDVCKEVLANLFVHAGRWRRINFELVGDMDFGAVLKALSPSKLSESISPRVECFILRLSGWDTGDSMRLTRTITLSPSLRKIDFQWVCFERQCIELAPLHALQTLHLDYLAFPQLLRVLSSCTSLEDFSLRIVDDSIDLTIPEERICVPWLKRLKFHFVKNVDRVFESVLLPSLESLTLDAGLGVSAPFPLRWSGWAALSTMVEASNGHLRALTLDFADGQATEEAVTGFLIASCLTGLLELTISSTITEVTLHALTQQPFHLPKLQRLRLSQCQSVDGVLCSLVHARKDTLLFVYARLTAPVAYREDLSIAFDSQTHIELDIDGPREAPRIPRSWQLVL